MIKLIATDIDGTLVKDSSPELYPEIISVIRRLTDQGILFFAASGRTYYSIRSMFLEVADRIGYIAENGAHIRYRDQDLSVTEMRREYVDGIIKETREVLPESGIVVSRPDGTLLETKDEKLVALIRDGYHNKYKVVEDALAEEGPFVKVAVHGWGSIRSVGEERMIPHWSDKVQACMAGEEWIDYMDKSVSKGNAIRFLQNYFGIAREETMAFGDNNNDIEMLQAVGESYAVENARQEVRKAAKYICSSYDEKGVYQVLRSLAAE